MQTLFFFITAHSSNLKMIKKNYLFDEANDEKSPQSALDCCCACCCANGFGCCGGCVDRACGTPPRGGGTSFGVFPPGGGGKKPIFPDQEKDIKTNQNKDYHLVDIA